MALIDLYKKKRNLRWLKGRMVSFFHSNQLYLGFFFAFDRIYCGILDAVARKNYWMSISIAVCCAFSPGHYVNWVFGATTTTKHICHQIFTIHPKQQNMCVNKISHSAHTSAHTVELRQNIQMISSTHVKNWATQHKTWNKKQNYKRRHIENETRRNFKPSGVRYANENKYRCIKSM